MKLSRRSNRRGIVAVEAAFIMPLAIILMFGAWEVGRMVQCQEIMNNAAREGARMAAGGYVNGVAVTVSQVQQTVRDYLTDGGFPATAVSGANITLTCQASPAWTDPCDALPLDPFTVKVTIPAGAPFNSLRWSLLPQLTTTTQLAATVKWLSTNNSAVTVDTSLPY